MVLNGRTVRHAHSVRHIPFEHSMALYSDNSDIMFIWKCFLPSCLFWSTLGEGIIHNQLTQFLPSKCDNAVLCATSMPSKTLSVRSKGQCTYECRHLRESCVGLNYINIGNTCELFAANPTNFSDNAGCEYLQVSRQLFDFRI